MVTGMWVELMYIGTNISQDSYNYTGLVNIISKQKGIVREGHGTFYQEGMPMPISSVWCKTAGLKTGI